MGPGQEFSLHVVRDAEIFNIFLVIKKLHAGQSYYICVIMLIKNVQSQSDLFHLSFQRSRISIATPYKTTSLSNGYLSKLYAHADDIASTL